MNRLTLNEMLELSPGQRHKIHELQSRGYSIVKQWIRCSKKKCKCRTAPYINGHLDKTFLHGPYVYAKSRTPFHTNKSIYIGRFGQSYAADLGTDPTRTATDR